jgi:hypothetical protein
MFVITEVTTDLTHAYDVLCSRFDRDSRLGAGVFGAAFAHPKRNDIVIKIGRNTPGMCGLEKFDYLKEEPYLNWIKATFKFPTKYAPKVYSVDVFHNSDRGAGVVFAVVLERLEPSFSARSSAIQKLAPTIERVQDLTRKHKSLIQSKNKDLRNLGYALDSVWSRHGKDLHDGNWLIRREADGSEVPVITDPAV